MICSHLDRCASTYPTFMHPEGNIAQYFTGQKLVKRLGEFLRIIHPSQSKVLRPPNIHVGFHYLFVAGWFDDIFTFFIFFQLRYLNWEQTLKCRHSLSIALFLRVIKLQESISLYTGYCTVLQFSGKKLEETKQWFQQLFANSL